MTEFYRRIRNAWLCLTQGHYTIPRPDHSKPAVYIRPPTFSSASAVSEDIRASWLGSTGKDTA